VSSAAFPAPTVLVVEDEFFIRLAVADELRARDFNVLEAVNSDEALNLLAAHDVKLLFTDISMPGAMDGNALIRATRRDNPHVVVVAASASAPCDEVEAIIRKPYDPTEAAIIVRQLLRH
jgi:CheY-like chemotaxis protein